MREINAIKLISIILLLNFKALAGYATEVCPENEDKVYSQTIQIKDQSVYFYMEKLESEQQINNWGKYTHLCLNAADIYQKLYEAHKIKESLHFDEEMQEQTGFSIKEFETYKIRFEKFANENFSSLTVAKGIEKGVRAFSPELRVGHYVVYASKREVGGKFPFPEGFFSEDDDRPLHKDATLKSHYTHFKDILMVVCSWGHTEGSKNFYENRGIFRNPVSAFEDGKSFPGLSVKLHGFSALFTQSYSPHKQYLFVRSAKPMTEVLSRIKWNQEEFMLGGKALDKCTDFTTYPQPFKASFADTPCYIKIEALIRLFLN